MKKFILVFVLVAAGGGAWYYKTHLSAHATEVKFRTTKVEKGDVVEGVNASGVVQPLLNVQVGTQVSGTIEKLFKDFNDKVAANEVIALIDSQRYVAQVAQDTAALGRSVADVERVRAQLVQAERDLKRSQTLWDKKLISDADLDASTAAAGSLRAQLAYSEAVVKLSQAALDQDKVNLNYCTITSPTSGVIVSRNVDVGQTVAASFSTPTLFVIANDLTKIQIQASVPEADIGRIKEKQHATFTVDAHPEHVFEGRVSQVRLASTTVSNVVTYTVVIDAENPDGLLLPGMTANVTFEVATSKKDALHVMTTALRFDPTPDLLEPEAREKLEKREGEKAAAKDGKKHEGGKESRKGHGGSKGGKIYVKAAGGLHPIPVKLGISDGAKVEIEPRLEADAALLTEGTDVVIGIQLEEEETASNPFAPSFGRGRRGGH